MVKRKLPPELENWLFVHYSDKTNKELAAELTEMLKRENQKQLERFNLLLEEDFCDGTKKVIQRQIDAIMEFKGISESSIKRYARILHCPKKSRNHLVYCNQGKARATNIKRWQKKAEKVEHIMEWLRTFGLMEKPRVFDPRGQATLTPSGKIWLTLCDKIKMTPQK